MPIKALIFLAAFILCSGGALFIPLLGAIGYVLHYIMGLGWWAAPFSHWGIRYSYTLALATAVGAFLHLRKLRFGKPFLIKQENLTVLFLALVWLSILIGGKITSEHYVLIDPPYLKFSKIVIFSLLLTHIVTRIKSLDILFWAFILATFYLSVKAYQAPRQMFSAGRLENLGGSDFRAANDLAVFLAAMVFVIGIMFLKTNWLGKILCFCAGVLALNAIILTRSRTGLLGLIGGAVVLALFVPQRHRGKIIACLVVAGIGFILLMDPRFIIRSKTILNGQEARDSSSQSRLEIWQGALKMISDHPFGVGAGNFYQNIGHYAPAYKDRDAHNTYVRCAAELGVQGIALLLVLIINAALMFRQIRRKVAELPDKYRAAFQLTLSGAAASLAVFIVAGLTGTMLYFEVFWWWLLMPVCLKRCFDNLLADVAVSKIEQKASTSALPRKKTTVKKES